MKKELLTSAAIIALVFTTTVKAGIDDLIPDYSKVYTVKIYDQSGIEFNNREENDIEKDIIRTLKRNKKNEINNKCTIELQRMIEEKQIGLNDIKRAMLNFAESDAKQNKKRSWLGGFLRGAAGIATVLGRETVGVTGVAAAAVVSATCGATSNTFFEGTNAHQSHERNDIELRKVKAQTIEQDISKLQAYEKLLKEGIKKESTTLLEMEEKYVLNKRHLDPALQQRIETALIAARGHSIVIGGVKADAFVSDALSIPREVKNLTGKRWEDVHRDFYADPVFSKYATEVQLGLLSIIRNIYCHSDETKESIDRGVYYLFGAPGVGKSKAADRIPEFLDLPHFELRVRNEQDLATAALEGTPMINANPQAGAFISALRATDSKGKSYTNPVLVIHDFDRIFLGSSPTALSFLLDFLDLRNTKFMSHFFGCQFPSGHFTTLITGNFQIPREQKYMALIDRVDEKFICSMPETNLRNILQDVVEKSANDQGFHYFNQEDYAWVIDDVIKENPGISVRKAEKKVKEFFNTEASQCKTPPRYRPFQPQIQNEKPKSCSTIFYNYFKWIAARFFDQKITKGE